MSAVELRVVRRAKGTPRPAALTAASAPVTNPQDVFKAAGLGGRRDNWQNEAWDMLCVGEFRFYVRFRAGSCARCRLVASEIDPDTGEPTGSIAEDNAEGKRVMQIVRKIAGGPLGQAQLIKRAAECLSIPGEFWVAILIRDDGEKWFVVTREEIKPGTRSDSVMICLPDGQKHDFAPGVDSLFRVWNPHPRKASEPDSPARAVLEPLREIMRTTKRISNADLSRLISAGILFIPQEASLPSQQAPVSADKPGDPPAAETPQRPAQALQDQIVAVASTAAKEGPDSMASLVPLVASAPGDHLDKIKHLTFGEEITKVALETRTDAIARLAMGLDMEPEQLLGLGKNANHWSAHLIADHDVQLHVAPVMQTFCDAVYDSVLRNVLAADGIDPDKYTLWFDASAITADPDKTDEAQAAFDGGAITAAAYVRLLDLPDDALYDLTTLEGCQVAARDAVTKDPTLWPTLAPLIGAVAGIEFPQPALPSAPPADGGVDDEPVDPGDEPATEGDAAAAISRRDGYSMAVELMVNRALGLAGKRRVGSGDGALKARLRNVEAHDYHRMMPPVGAGEVAGLIKGWDSGLDDIAERYGLDADQVRQVVAAEARRQMTSVVVDA